MRKSLFKNSPYLAIIAAILFLVSGCKDDPVLINREEIPDTPDIDEIEELTEEYMTSICVDVFTISTLNTYYLWIDDEGRTQRISDVLNPDTCLHPEVSLKKVLSSEDRWTSLYDNMSEVLDSSNGIETTFGMDTTPWLFSKDSDKVLIVVNFVYPNSPAEAAGIKRGDIFTKMDGVTLTRNNYTKFYDQSHKSVLEFGNITKDNELIDTGIEIELTPEKLYEEPVIKTAIFDFDSKKVGYLAYTSFVESTNTLQAAFEDFINEGVSELVLDLRYNGGGFVSSCVSLASMLAPKEIVEEESVFIKNVYNKAFTDYYTKNKIDLDYNFDKKYIPYNLGIKKIYGLVSKNTASASEMLLIGLSPYMDVEIIGETTHGKFCSGIMTTPKDYFEVEGWDEGQKFYNTYKNYFKDWGIYVMVGSFTDKEGNNKSKPNGIVPNYLEEDYPLDGYQLGDENETLLKVALEHAGKKYKTSGTRAGNDSKLSIGKIELERNSFAIIDKPLIDNSL